MKFDFLDSFLTFTILPFSYWTYYSDLFPMDYLSYSYLFANFTPRKGTRTTKDGINRSRPTRTSLQYGLHLLKARSPPAHTK